LIFDIQQSKKTMTTMRTKEEEGGVAHGINIVGRAARAEMGGSSGAMARAGVRS
jgi:hypothetical protein